MNFTKNYTLLYLFFNNQCRRSWFSVDYLGYFIHDTIDIVVNGQSSNMWEVIPHHIAVMRHLLKSGELTSIGTFSSLVSLLVSCLAFYWPTVRSGHCYRKSVRL